MESADKGNCDDMLAVTIKKELVDDNDTGNLCDSVEKQVSIRCIQNTELLNVHGFPYRSDINRHHFL